MTYFCEYYLRLSLNHEIKQYKEKVMCLIGEPNSWKTSLFTPITRIIPARYLLFFLLLFCYLFFVICSALSGKKHQRKLGSVFQPLRGALFRNEAHLKVECLLDFVQFIEVVYVSVDRYIAMITKQKAFNKRFVDQKNQASSWMKQT